MIVYRYSEHNITWVIGCAYYTIGRTLVVNPQVPCWAGVLPPLFTSHTPAAGGCKRRTIPITIAVRDKEVAHPDNPIWIAVSDRAKIAAGVRERPASAKKQIILAAQFAA